MTRKAEFDAEEWTVLAQAPALAGVYVARAEKGGQLKEALAMGRFYADGREQARSQLLKDILATPPGLAPEESRADFEAIEEHALATLRRADAILAAKATPEERGAYGSFTVELATTVAAAHKEGGFLGIGGTPISEKEQAAIDLVDRALGGG